MPDTPGVVARRTPSDQDLRVRRQAQYRCFTILRCHVALLSSGCSVQTPSVRERPYRTGRVERTTSVRRASPSRGWAEEVVHPAGTATDVLGCGHSRNPPHAGRVDALTSGAVRCRGFQPVRSRRVRRPPARRGSLGGEVSRTRGLRAEDALTTLGQSDRTWVRVVVEHHHGPG